MRACNISKVISQFNLRHGNHFFTESFYYERCVEVFVEDANAR